MVEVDVLTEADCCVYSKQSGAFNSALETREEKC